MTQVTATHELACFNDSVNSTTDVSAKKVSSRKTCDVSRTDEAAAMAAVSDGATALEGGVDAALLGPLATWLRGLLERTTRSRSAAVVRFSAVTARG